MTSPVTFWTVPRERALARHAEAVPEYIPREPARLIRFQTLAERNFLAASSAQPQWTHAGVVVFVLVVGLVGDLWLAETSWILEGLRGLVATVRAVLS